MSRCKRYQWFYLVAILAMILTPRIFADRNDILVVPARNRLVRLAMDIEALRNTTIISYQATEDPLQPRLHAWIPTSRNWMRVDIADIKNTRGVPVMPDRAYIVGLQNQVPEIIPTLFSHARETRTFLTFSIAEILTSLDRDMQFSDSEWRSLAERYNLQLTEINAEQRRWGRFGPPRRYRDTTPKPTSPARLAPSPQEWISPINDATAPPPPVQQPPQPKRPEPHQAVAIPVVEKSVVIPPEVRDDLEKVERAIQQQPMPDSDTMFEYLAEYTPTNETIDPIPPNAYDQTLDYPEKGAPEAATLPPTEIEPEATEQPEEEFPIK